MNGLVINQMTFDNYWKPSGCFTISKINEVSLDGGAWTKVLGIRNGGLFKSTINDMNNGFKLELL